MSERQVLRAMRFPTSSSTTVVVIREQVTHVEAVDAKSTTIHLSGGASVTVQVGIDEVMNDLSVPVMNDSGRRVESQIARQG